MKVRNKQGAMYIDTAVKMTISVVVGALLYVFVINVCGIQLFTRLGEQTTAQYADAARENTNLRITADDIDLNNIIEEE